MRFTGQFVTAKLDINAYKRVLTDYLRAKLKEATSKWLIATTGRVPVWSGMARGSLLEVAEFSQTTLVISPKDGVKSRIPLGRALGTAEPTENLDDFKIEIETSVPHYVSQEVRNVGVSKSAPWRSFDAGQEAAKEVLGSTILPKPILKKKITRL